MSSSRLAEKPGMQWLIAIADINPRIHFNLKFAFISD